MGFDGKKLASPTFLRNLEHESKTIKNSLPTNEFLEHEGSVQKKKTFARTAQSLNSKPKLPRTRKLTYRNSNRISYGADWLLSAGHASPFNPNLYVFF